VTIAPPFGSFHQGDARTQKDRRDTWQDGRWISLLIYDRRWSLISIEISTPDLQEIFRLACFGW
jgi:hypothetical protein